MDSKNTQAKSGTVIKLLCFIYRFILSACLIASLLALFFCGAAELTVLNRGFYTSVMTGDSYIANTQAQIESEIKTVCKIYSFPYDAIEPATSTEILKALSAEYASGLFDTLFTGSEPSVVAYPADVFYKRIAVYAVVLLEDNIFASETSQQYLAEFFCEKADFALNSFTQKNITEPIYNIMSREFIIKLTLPEIMGKLTLPLAEVSLLLSVLLLIGRRNSFKSRLYGTSGVIWCSAALVFIPCLLLLRYNLPERLPIAASPLKNFVSAFLTSFIGFVYNISAYSFAAATMLLVIAAILLAIKKKNNI
ncbi:MAG: hypothetical protein ACYCWE_01885 [Eubacteriales bacterium]